jgi:short-subunit dehydrogenase
MAISLSGARCLVTGGSRGLGRHIALQLASRGAHVLLCARSREGLAEVAREIAAQGGRASVHPVDLSDRAAVARLIDALEAEGGVDVLVNNAGIETIAYFHEIPLAEIFAMLEVNLVATMHLTRLVLPGMVARQRGHIVNIASLAGKSGPPLAESYAVTKAGLIALTQSLRASYAGSGVSSSVVCPGYIHGEGMFADRAQKSGSQAPRIVGSSPPEAVGRAVVRAIERDAPEILVTPSMARLLGAVGQLQPRMHDWLKRVMKLRAFYEKQRDAGA